MNKSSLICIIIIGIFLSGCVDEEKTEAPNFETLTSQENTASSPVPIETVTIDQSILQAQGWKIKEFPEFYSNLNFLYEKSSIGTVYISRDENGNVAGIYAISDPNLEKNSLTVNDITFNNFIIINNEQSPRSAVFVDIENPGDKIIKVYLYEIIVNWRGEYMVPIEDKNWAKAINFDHSEKRALLGNYQFLDVNNKGPYEGLQVIVLNVQFLPTPKRGNKITQTTEWFPLNKEQKIELPEFGTYMKVEQLRPRGNVIFTAKLDNSDGTTMSDASKNHITITFNLKEEDGKIWEGDTYPSQFRKDFLQVMTGRDNGEILTTTNKIVGWQATIEFTPLIQ